MNKAVVYTLNTNGMLGCFPECVIVDTDDVGEFSVNFVKVSRKNKSNFSSLFDATDEILLDCCFRLEKDIIISKISDREARTWENLLNKYFDGNSRKKKTTEIEYIKDYLTDYINGFQNTFFENISDKLLYLPNGKFPFTWDKITAEIEMPEMLYCFDNKPDNINYSLDLTCKNKPLNILDGVLVSRKSARVLVKNKIYDFGNEIEGAKLVPFFSREFISISQTNALEYIQKVIMPLAATNRVVASGFEIETINELTNAVLRVKEISLNKQVSLFEDESENPMATEIVLELIFEYKDFQFWAGQGGTTNKLDMNDDSFTIYHVERDKESEQSYINELKKIGLDLDAKVRKIRYIDGIEWINEHYKHIESAGIEIRFLKKSKKPYNIFVGERKITVELEEGHDWFDIKGKVEFGKYKIPILQLLNYIKHNKREILLPNGEYVQIPQAWIDEYKSLADLCKIEDGKATISKHYCAIADELKKNSKVKLSVKENMRRFLENNLDVNFDLPKGFTGELRHYQQQGYNWLRLLDDMGLGGCLADDMGLGKTIQALCLLQKMKELNRETNLLVVPTSLVYNWEQEAEKFTPDLNVYVHAGNQRTKNSADFGEPDILLTSYAILRRDRHLFATQQFNYVILDEAQTIKNPQADITQVCLSLQAKRFLTLTGTPLENSMTDLWSQVHFFNRNMLGSANNFNRLCKQPEKQELYRQLLRPFLLRRQKNNVLKDLPEKSIILQWCNMSEEQNNFYRETRNKFVNKFLENKKENDTVNPVVLLEGLLRLRQAANHPSLVDSNYNDSSGKFETVCEMLSDVVEQGDKVLVFSSFTKHLELYKNFLDDRNIKYCYLDGSTKDRKEQVEKFQQNDEFQIFLLSLKAGGIGLNLTKASYVFLLDPWWNPAAEAQAYDRAHRIGQQNKVFVYKFITRNTIEEKILKLQEEKKLLFDSMVNADNEITKNLNINEIMKLIE
ncbi:MAG TPA: DEAD/DEAH box helicase [Paludibacter sp.]|nr:DEAD/DEAH box helicase [Paludibacter sp.]